MNERIEMLMKTLDITKEEAIEMLEDDEKIDKGEKLFEQTAEQKANSKKASSVGTRKSTTTKREKTPNEDRLFLLKVLSSALCDNHICNGVVNPECEIGFTYNDVSYSVKLIAHRPKK